MSNSITIADGVLSIHALDVTDKITLAYVNNLEPDMRVAGIVNCLRVGASALTFASDQTGATLLAETVKSSAESTRLVLGQVSKTAEQSVAKSAESIGKSIGQLLSDLDKELSKKLDPANTASIIGKLRTALVDDYQKVTEKVRQDLDLANPQSPLSALRTELEKNEERRYEALTGKLGDLLERLASKAAANAERSKSTRKGSDFEAATEEFLTAESSRRKDLVRRTGTEFGLDQNLIGDFVIEINPSEGRGARLVIECKNGQKNTTGLARETDKAMSNRGAAFGISVVTDATVISESIHPYGDDQLIVRVPALPDGDGWDFMALGIALECARWKTIMGRTVAGSLDVNRIQAEIEEAFGTMNKFTEVKRKITAGKNQLDGIWDYVDEIRRDLVTTMQRIRDTITEASSELDAA